MDAVTQLQYPERTMYEMIEKIAVEYPTAPAYEFYGKTTDFQTFLKKILRTARAFAAQGIGPGSVVTLCVPNIPQGIDCFYALNRVGAIANMIHPLSAQSEISFYLNISESSMIVVPDLFYEKVEAALADVDHPVTVLVLRMQDELPFPASAAFIAAKGRAYLRFPNTDHAMLWKRFLKQGDRSRASLPVVRFDKNRTSVILYSGGSTGTPKGICLSDLNMNALAMQCRSQIPYELGPGLKMLSCMPMFHGFGLGVNLHTVLIYGALCILMPTFNIKTYAEMLARKKPNYIAGVPTIYEALLHMPQLNGVDLSFLRGMFCGGDSLSIELKKKVDEFLQEHHAQIQVQEGYGLTECVTASCLTPADRYKPGSIGLPFPDTYYAIVSPGTDDVLPPGEEGEIILRGPSVMLGYLKNEEETANTLRTLKDGNTWLYTGDLGSMDEEGFVYFKQRIKRMIITNGYNVYPGQVENVIDSTPEVAYSCVIGVKDERRGQRVRAYVVPREELPAEEYAADREGKSARLQAVREKIENNLRQHVAGYAIPKEIMFRSELPKTLVGKVAFRILEEEAEQEEKE